MNEVVPFFRYGIVYLITNKINGRAYIGITTKNLEHRLRQHLKSKTPFGQALRKYGIDNFQIEEILTAFDKETLAEQERKFIKFYKDSGIRIYNIKDGGEGSRKQLTFTFDKLLERHPEGTESLRLWFEIRHSLSPEEQFYTLLKFYGMIFPKDLRRIKKEDRLRKKLHGSCYAL